VLVWKIGKRLAGLLLAGPAVVVVLIVRLLRPVVWIRFGWIRNDRLGHFAIDTELYLCERELGIQPHRAVDLFYYQDGSRTCNRQLARMCSRTLRVWRAVRPVEELNRWLPGGGPHAIILRSRDVHGSRDVEGLLARTRVHLALTSEEESRGRKALQALGIPPGAPFVCFYARDEAYLDAVSPERDWRYHDFRNATIQHYVPAVEELTRRGYFAVRMGSIVQEPLKSANPMVIDYPTSGHRTDFLDIVLGATCAFFLGCPGGIVALPMIFRRPIAFVNSIPLAYTLAWNPGSLCILKKLWLRSEHRFLTFQETFDSGAARFIRSFQYEGAGLDVVENTPEEITALAIEMDERIKGTWRATEEDEALQTDFWSLFEPDDLNQTFRLRIGTAFLRQHRDWLRERAVEVGGTGQAHGR
jgi:putative glycosyltransferase (TIGR04372 family)